MCTNSPRVEIGIICDRDLLRECFVSLLRHQGFCIQMECSNAREFIAQFDNNNLPDIVLIDIDRHAMEAIETTLWLSEHLPSIKVIAFTIKENKDVINKILKAGAKGYFSKDADPAEIKSSIKLVRSKGYSYPLSSVWKSGYFEKQVPAANTDDSVSTAMLDR